MKLRISIVLLLTHLLNLFAENGHDLWLRNTRSKAVNVICSEKSPTLEIAIRELQDNWLGDENTTIHLIKRENTAIKNDGFIVSPDTIWADTDIGILYGTYEILRRQQTAQPIEREISNPSYQHRILNHWDNLNGTVERGYAGESIFWKNGKDNLMVTGPEKALWLEYARANASVGINGTVLNNVNASPNVLKPESLERIRTIAQILRPYGIKTYISINFSSPAIIGGLKTSDPLNKEVVKWWKTKVNEVYDAIPDFGGFLVKANSEGQPGPQDFGRTHADGANMLADALKPYGGIVMWRAFVYNSTEDDRAKQAFDEFMPFDGKFRDNVIIQVKNGPIDFQPREPFSPLFGAMKKTAIMPELQITQEYLGQSVHLVFLATMWEEFLQSDTYRQDKRSTVARCTDGSVYDQKYTAIAGVANIGRGVNWCGHHFAQANWYAFGRLAWNNLLNSEQIADEWIKQTFGQMKGNEVDFSTEWQNYFLQPVKNMMLLSHEAAVNYMMPLGFHHIFKPSHHYGPAPWWGMEGIRKDWTNPYYHQADSIGVGFNRSSTGSNAVAQYHEPLQSMFNNLETCPEKYLLWFHHVPWNYYLKSGRTLWEDICYHYETGVKQVSQFQQTWNEIQDYVDSTRFLQVKQKLNGQHNNAVEWKDACLQYFQLFSNEPIPEDIEPPKHSLEELKKNDLNKP